MGYKLAANNGDTLAVPQLVLTHLTQTDGDTIRAALYILQTHDTDPRTMARALALPSIEAAKRALQYWAGAGLLVSERGAAPAPAAEPARVDLASVANDPYVAVLCQEAQSIFGKTLSRSEMQRLVGLYLNDGWQPDVILLCCAEVTRLGRRTIAAVTHLLARWREDGVETGEDAERWLQRAKQREAWCPDELGAPHDCPLARGNGHRARDDRRSAAARQRQKYRAVRGRHSAGLACSGHHDGRRRAPSGPAGGQQHRDDRAAQRPAARRLRPEGPVQPQLGGHV